MALILSGDTGVPASGMPTGSVIQTVTAVKTDTSTNTTTTYADISGLSVTITPISTSSKILVTLNLCGSNDSGSMAVQLVRDSTPIALGTAASGNQLNVTESNYYNNGDANSMRSSGIVTWTHQLQLRQLHIRCSLEVVLLETRMLIGLQAQTTLPTICALFQP